MFRTRILLAIGVAMLVGLGAVACGADSKPESEPPTAAEAGLTESVPTQTVRQAPASSVGQPQSPQLTVANESAPSETVAEATATPAPQPEPATLAAVATSGRTGDEELAPELTAITGWINSEPFTLEDQRGKVVLVDFYTWTCVNCIRTFPYLKDWYRKYEDRGLVIVGVQAYEFEFEKKRENIVAAAEKAGLVYPIAIDNNRGTWGSLRQPLLARQIPDRQGWHHTLPALWGRGLRRNGGEDQGAPGRSGRTPLAYPST